MIIGAVHFELFLYGVQSLKEKRSIIKSIHTKIKQRYNVSIAEIDFQNSWQRAALAIVTVSNERLICEREMERALNLIDKQPEVERTVTTYEWL